MVTVAKRVVVRAEATDAELIRDMCDREADAFGEVLVRYGPPVLGLARRTLGDDSLAQDLTQEVLGFGRTRCVSMDDAVPCVACSSTRPTGRASISFGAAMLDISGKRVRPLSGLA